MPTSKSILVRKAQIDETLATPSAQGKKLLEPFKSFATAHNLPFKILEDHHLTTNDAEVHKTEGDLWLCLEGEMTFIYGGTLINAEMRKKPDGMPNEAELRGSGIEGGITEVLRLGDWLWIPPGEPHQHLCQGTGRLVIIKILTNTDV